MERRIETNTSRTAEFTCLSRAVSYYEKVPQYKSNDNIAPLMVPKFVKVLLPLKIFRTLYKNKFAPGNLYEYVIARTKYIDEVFSRAIEKDFDQVLVFGAGFDSRAIRLTQDNKKTRVFELDAYNTQEAKIQQLKKRGITVPDNLVFISIDFNREVLADKLAENNFQKDKRTLFIMEGLLMYLDREAIEGTFELVNQYAGPGSEIVFDYVFTSVLRGENSLKGEQDAVAMVKEAQEEWTFGLDEGEISSFLNKYQMRLKEHLNPEELEKRYFQDDKGRKIGRINGAHGLVLAVK